MKIALVTDSFTTGGGLEHIYQICLGIPDIEFGVFAKEGNEKEKFELLPNVKIFSSGYDKKYIKSFNPDIVHIHHLKPLLKLYNIDIKTIFTVHGIHLHKYEFIPGIKSIVSRFLRLNLEKFLYKKIDKIITVSNDDREYLKKYYNIDSEVIYNGIDYTSIEKIVISNEELRNKLNIPMDKKIYLTVARFDFQKGYDILVKAIKILNMKNKLNDKLFLFVGNGILMEEIKNQVYENKIDNKILFLGIKRNVYDLMKASDYLILPSRWEGLPITLIESYFAGLPQIISDTYGNKEIGKIIGSTFFKNLDYVNLAKKIEIIDKELKEKDFYTKTKEERMRYLFSIEKMIKSLKSVYMNLLS